MKNYQFEKKASFTHILQRDHRQASPIQIKHSKNQDPMAQSLFSELFSRGSTPRQKQKSFSKALHAENQPYKSKLRLKENYVDSAISENDFMNKSKQILKEHFDKQNQDRNLICHNACTHPPVSFVMLQGEKLMLCKACSDNLTRQGFEVTKVQSTKPQPQKKPKNDNIKLKMLQVRKQLNERKEEMLERWRLEEQRLDSITSFLRERIQVWHAQWLHKLREAFEGDLEQINLKLQTVQKLMSRSTPKSLELTDKLKASLSFNQFRIPVLDLPNLKIKFQHFLAQANMQRERTVAECQTDRTLESPVSDSPEQLDNQQQIQGIQKILTESQEDVQFQGREEGELRYVQSCNRMNMSKSLMSMENPLDWHE